MREPKQALDVIGERVGAYKILQQIGEGGMGSVWLAEHSVIRRRAAIKMLHASLSGHTDIKARFFNEARAATAIQDAGIVQIFDFGEHIDGRAYIVMELLDGEPLDRRLGRLGRLSIREALRIMRQVASALAAAHKSGIIHRDLKPENVYLVKDTEVTGGERAKLLDFGIAKISDDSSVKTATAVLMGTPTFMSPEQCRGAGHVDHRSDIYSLGCVLFTLLSGRPPFLADGPGEIIAMHLREPPPIPSSIVPEIPLSVDSLVLRCLEKVPSRRYASSEEVVQALEAISLPMAERPQPKRDETTEKMPALSTVDLVESAADSATLTTANPATLTTTSPVRTTTTLSTSTKIGQARTGALSGRRGWKLAGGLGLLIAMTIPILVSARRSTETAERGTEEDSERSRSSRSAAPPPAPILLDTKPVDANVDRSTTPAHSVDVQPLATEKTLSSTPVPTAVAAKTPAPVLPAEETARTPTETVSVEATSARLPTAVPAEAARKPIASTGPSTADLLGEIGAAPPATALPAAAPVAPALVAANSCAGQAAKLTEFLSRHSAMSPLEVVRGAKAFMFTCLNSKQLSRLALVVVPAACSIDDEATVLSFHDLVASPAIRSKCKKFLDNIDGESPGEATQPAQ